MAWAASHSMSRGAIRTPDASASASVVAGDGASRCVRELNVRHRRPGQRDLSSPSRQSCRRQTWTRPAQRRVKPIGRSAQRAGSSAGSLPSPETRLPKACESRAWPTTKQVPARASFAIFSGQGAIKAVTDACAAALRIHCSRRRHDRRLSNQSRASERIAGRSLRADRRHVFGGASCCTTWRRGFPCRPRSHCSLAAAPWPSPPGCRPST